MVLTERIDEARPHVLHNRAMRRALKLEYPLHHRDLCRCRVHAAECTPVIHTQPSTDHIAAPVDRTCNERDL